MTLERDRHPAKAPLMSGALLAVIAIMASLAATSWVLDDRSHALAERHRQLAANIERIRYYDEALTMSARFAAASGDLSYRVRYDGLAPELDALITETIRLAANPSAEAKIRSTDSANVRLVQLETEAFNLVEQGDGADALKLLAGTEYQAEKQRYSVGLEGAIAEIDNAAWAEDQQDQVFRLLMPVMSIVGGLVIVGVWLRYRRSTADLLAEANRNAQRSAVFARLSDRLTFAIEEADLVEAAIGALSLLVPTSSGNLLLLNASKDRLSVSEAWHEGEQPSGLPQLDRPNQCPAVRRGLAHLAEDLSDPLAVRCPAHPVDRGSVLCVPLLALGQSVGVLHLARDRSGFTADDQWLAGRLAEQVALALANARLLRTMEGLAMADPLTGLYNMRFFDPLLERELAVSGRDGTAVGLIMLDIDHFKRFNDTNGHPAGDEALRTFANLLRSSIRESDTVARYGGEEFVILLHGTGLADAAATAEKLRKEVEGLVVVLGPGRFARLTASFGVGSTVAHGHDRTALIGIVDQALYQAKELGRNRVVVAEATVPEPAVSLTRVRSARARRDATPPLPDAAIG
jgi:diguanylate cyclase (GGDEF)-like protein